MRKLFYISIVLVALVAPATGLAKPKKSSTVRLAANPYEVNVYVSRYSRFKHEAAKGYPEAQYRLAHVYYAPPRGSGFSKNKKRAFELFEKAAMQNHRDAQYNIGVMYANGEGTEKNRIYSLAWMQIASDNGHKNAAKIYQQLIKKFTEDDKNTVVDTIKQLKKEIKQPKKR